MHKEALKVKDEDVNNDVVRAKSSGSFFYEIKKMCFRIVLFSLACIICFGMMCGCSGKDKDKIIYDYYGVTQFVLPFEHENVTSTDALYFNTNLNMEQMTERIKNAGYQGTLHEFEGVKRIFITVINGSVSSYFIIYDKTLSEFLGNGKSDRYSLRALTASIQVADKDSNYETYVFLFPLHVSDISELTKTRKIYCTFNEFADFYRATGRKDVQIDVGNKTVTFTCKGTDSTEQDKTNPNFATGKVVMQYVEKSSGNYIDIQHIE